MSRAQALRVEQHGAVTLAILDHPPLNLISRKVAAEVRDAIRAYQADPSQRCMVLTGHKRAFAAGADIREMHDFSFADIYGSDFGAEWDEVAATQKPWIAAVAGLALGGGCELAMMADFIIAAHTAMFGQPEIKLGITPGWGGTQRLTRAIGKAKAMDMCLTGRMMDAQEAERSRLIARVVPADELLQETIKTAQLVATMTPLAAAVNKELVMAAFETGLAQGLLLERRMLHGLTGVEHRKVASAVP